MSVYKLDYCKICMSIIPLSGDTGETLVVRTCGLDSNEQTADVELVRVPHTCGIFKFEASQEEQRGGHRQRKLTGCIEVCDGPDGCNGAKGMVKGSAVIHEVGLLLVAILSS